MNSPQSQNQPNFYRWLIDFRRLNKLLVGNAEDLRIIIPCWPHRIVLLRTSFIKIFWRWDETNWKMRERKIYVVARGSCAGASTWWNHFKCHSTRKYFQKFKKYDTLNSKPRRWTEETRFLIVQFICHFCMLHSDIFVFVSSKRDTSE